MTKRTWTCLLRKQIEIESGEIEGLTFSNCSGISRVCHLDKKILFVRREIKKINNSIFLQFEVSY